MSATITFAGAIVSQNGSTVNFAETAKSGLIPIHPSAAKLPKTGMAFIDGSNLNWELLYAGSVSGTGISPNPSGLWQFTLPTNYSGNPQITLNVTVKQTQLTTGSFAQFDIYALSVPNDGSNFITGSLTFVNSGQVAFGNFQDIDKPKQVVIPLSNYSFGAAQTTLLQVARNNAGQYNVVGSVALIGGAFEYVIY